MGTALLLSIAIFFPSFKFLGLNVTLLDFLPLFFLFLFLSKKKFSFSFPDRVFTCIYYLNIGMVAYWLFSSVIAFFFMQDSSGFLKSMLQLYRRGVVFLILPLFLLNEKRLSFSTLTKVLTVFVLLSALFGELINFSPAFREFYLSHIESSAQILVYPVFRNMGTIGEASYFAMLIAIVLLMNLSIPDYKYRNILILLLVFSLFSTASKSTILALFVSLTVFLLFLKNKKEAFLFLLLTIFLLLILFYKGSYWMSAYLELAGESFGERVSTIWVTVIEMFDKYNLLYFSGLGFKGLKSYLGIEGAHNMFLGSLIDFGLLFGIFYFPVLFIIHLVFLWRISDKNYKVFFISMFSLLFIESMVHEPFYHYKVLALYFFITFSLIKGEDVEICPYSRLAYNVSRCREGTGSSV